MSRFLMGNVFALESGENYVQFSFALAEGQVAIYRSSNERYGAGSLVFVGIDPFA